MASEAKLVGINHVALEVGDIDQALELYGRLFAFELRGRIGDRMAFIDIGDQFLALSARESEVPDEDRHFGLVVDDKQAAREAVEREGLERWGSRGGGLTFRDPWGNQVQVVDYREIQFERTPAVKRALGIEGVEKTDEASTEIEEKGLG
jgi:catechol-2,3-dioxygenase